MGLGKNFGPISKSRKVSVFDRVSKSRIFFGDGSRSLGFVVFSFRLVFRSRMFQGSLVKFIELIQ